MAVGVARMAGAEVTEDGGVADETGDAACVGEAAGVEVFPLPVFGVLVGGTGVFVGPAGVLVDAAEVFVGGTGVFVGGMGVLVAGACVAGAATEMLPPVTVTPVMVGPPPLFEP